LRCINDRVTLNIADCIAARFRECIPKDSADDKRNNPIASTMMRHSLMAFISIAPIIMTGLST
jgi:hypothetical protein